MRPIPLRLIPKKGKKALKEKFQSCLEAWRKFSSRIQRNPFIKNFILDRDKVCQFCLHTFDDKKKRPFIVHHTDYDHFCGFDKIVNAPSEKREFKLPDCATCSLEKPELFKGCVSRLAAVHPMCNMLIEKMASRYYEQKGSFKEINASQTARSAENEDQWKVGETVTWVENILSNTQKTGSGRRHIRLGKQKVTVVNPHLGVRPQ